MGVTSQRSASSGMPWFRAASWSSSRLIASVTGQTLAHEPRTFTARAATRRIVTAEIADSSPMTSFARTVSGIVSVGLNAIEFVSET